MLISLLIFTLLKNRNDAGELRKLVTGNRGYENISKETAVMIREFADIKLPRRNKKGKYDMCKAILDLEKINQEIGKEIGKEIGEKALVTAIKNLMKNTQQSFEEVCASMGISSADMVRYKKMI